jgi:hypothetical protein
MRLASPVLATNPLRPSAEGAQPPEIGTSDILCRAPVPPAGSPFPASAARARLSSGSVLVRRARTDLARVGLAHERFRPGTPSIGSISNLAARADELLTNVFEGSLLVSHPSRVPRCSPPRHGLGYRFTLPGRFPARLAAGASSIKKMLLTNFCNCKSRHEHLLGRSTLEVTRSRDRGTFDGAKAPANNSSGRALDGA